MSNTATQQLVLLRDDLHFAKVLGAKMHLYRDMHPERTFCGKPTLYPKVGRSMPLRDACQRCVGTLRSFAYGKAYRVMEREETRHASR